MVFPKLRANRWSCLCGTIILAACDKGAPPPAAPAQPLSLTTPSLAITATKPTSSQATEKVPWSVAAESRFTATVIGRPIAMAAGQRCVKFRTLPFLQFQHNTLIQDACLEIPSNTTVVVQGGATLGIIATNGLRLGQNVRFSANGIQGRRGDRADFESIRYSPPSDSEISVACRDDGNQCSCPAGDANAAAILGHAGGAGSSGGRVIVAAARWVAGARAKGLVFDVSGGVGGPPGESGRWECKRGPFHCESGFCADGASRGPHGADGHVTVTVGASVQAPLVQLLNASTIPSAAITVNAAGSTSAFDAEAQALNEAAFNGGWDRRSGLDGF